MPLFSVCENKITTKKILMLSIHAYKIKYIYYQYPINAKWDFKK